MKKTLVIGASANSERYSYIATERLLKNGYDVVPLGIKPGIIHGLSILTGMPDARGIHTVTLYISPQHQVAYYTYLLNLMPQRIIFNPGAENTELAELVKGKGIEAIEACTLVLLSLGKY